MARQRHTDFDYLDDLRAQAGLLPSQAASVMGISRRTWFRWAAANRAPLWASVTLRALTGDLTPLGWKGWYIKDGELYHRDLNPRYYAFSPAHLLASVFCSCPAHQGVTRAQRQAEGQPPQESHSPRPSRAVAKQCEPTAALEGVESSTDYPREAAKE